MRTHASYTTLLAGLILAVVVSIPLLNGVITKSSSFSFELALQSTTNGIAQIFYDVGAGTREADSTRIQIRKTDIPAVYRFQLPQGYYRALRFDPIDREAVVTFSGAKILDSNGRVIQTFSALQFRIIQQISSLKVDGGSVQMTTAAGAYDPILEVSLGAPFVLKMEKGEKIRLWIEMVLGFFVICIPCWGLLWLVEARRLRGGKRVTTSWRNLATWASAHPKTAIAGMAVFAVVLSAYPVVFFGKSFVSPNNGTPLLYETFPTVPGYDDMRTENAMGSDVGAVMWAHLPYSIIESRAIFHDAELPLWNRYNSTGSTLLGQGQSMIGDPLHMIVLLARGASWAWDIKFLLAKMLFAAGLGFSVFAATRHLPSSLIMAFSSVFIGFFSFRFNHPAFFSMCYAPWILYCWIRIAQASTTQSSFLGMGGLLLANWTVINSGTVKEAYMLLVSLNLCGAAVFVLAKGDVRLKLKKSLQLLGGGALFVLISSPIWLTFLDALNQSYTSYDVPRAQQTRPGLLIGLFDDIFYREMTNEEVLYNPSANFMILLGVLWSLTQIKKMLFDRTYLAVGLSALIPLTLVFGMVPADVIVKIPFVGNIGHINNTFSCVLIIQLIVLAGFGVRTCWERFGHEKWTTDWVIVVLMLGAMLALYMASTLGVDKSRFFYGYGLSLVCAVVALPFITKQLIQHDQGTPVAGLFVLWFVCLASLHWRHGMYLDVGFDKYVMNPQVRVNLQAKSDAIEFIKYDAAQPFRAVGFGGNMFPGYNAALGIESIYGADALINPYYRELGESSAFERGWDWRYIVREETLADLKPIYDFLNIGYYLASHSNQPKLLPGLDYEGGFDLDVYHSDTAWPRAFFTNTLSSYNTPSELVEMIRGGDGRPFAAVQREELERNPFVGGLSGDQSRRRIVSATDYKLTNNTTSFRIRVPSKGVVVLTEAYLKGDFRLTVNGEPARYFGVNHAFKGTVVEKPGTYIVTYSYWPRHFTSALRVSAAGLVLLFIWAGYLWRAASTNGNLLKGGR